jgi:hypothetical protein
MGDASASVCITPGLWSIDPPVLRIHAFFIRLPGIEEL